MDRENSRHRRSEVRLCRRDNRLCTQTCLELCLGNRFRLTRLCLGVLLFLRYGLRLVRGLRDQNRVGFPCRFLAV